MVEDQTRIGSKDCVKFVQKKNEKNYIRIVSETVNLKSNKLIFTYKKRNALNFLGMLVIYWKIS